jgi:hypothetical protein
VARDADLPRIDLCVRQKNTSYVITIEIFAKQTRSRCVSLKPGHQHEEKKQKYNPSSLGFLGKGYSSTKKRVN